MRPFGSQKELELRRLRAISMALKGIKMIAIARDLGVDQRSVRRWKAAYRKEGVRGLEAKPAACGPMKWRGKKIPGGLPARKGENI